MATKKTTPKKAPTKKKTSVKVTKTTPKKAVAPKLIGLQPETESFMTLRVNRQTVYWLVLGAVVIAFTLWIMQLQADIQSIYDEIDANSALLSS